jgi:hypothetical protein
MISALIADVSYCVSPMSAVIDDVGYHQLSPTKSAVVVKSAIIADASCYGEVGYYRRSRLSSLIADVVGYYYYRRSRLSSPMSAITA